MNFAVYCFEACKDSVVMAAVDPSTNQPNESLTVLGALHFLQAIAPNQPTGTALVARRNFRTERTEQSTQLDGFSCLSLQDFLELSRDQTGNIIDFVAAFIIEASGILASYRFHDLWLTLSCGDAAGVALILERAKRAGYPVLLVADEVSLATTCLGRRSRSPGNSGSSLPRTD